VDSMNKVLEDYDEGLLDISKTIGNVPVDGICDMLDQLGDEAEGKAAGVDIGWRDTCDQLGGVFRKQEFTVIAGPPGNGKSYWALACCMFAEVNDFSWKYLPLEDSQRNWMRRIAAIVCDDWGILDYKQARDSINKVVANQNIIKGLQTSMCENPRKPVTCRDGKARIPDIPYDKVADWIYREGQKTDLIVIDPISIMDYDTGKSKTDVAGQRDFIKQVSGLVTQIKGHVMLVSHTTKKKTRNTPLHMDMIEGSQAFSKYCHNVLLLDHHDEKESTVYGAVGGTVSHKRTLLIDKARGSKGGGAQIALDFDRSGPVFNEYGVIRPNE